MKLIELVWAPTVTVLYVIASLVANRPIDYLVLAALIVLSITCILYARKLRQIGASPAELWSQPERIAQPAGKVEQPPQIEPPRQPVEPPPIEPPKERPDPAARIEPQAERREPPVPVERPVERSEPPPAEPRKTAISDGGKETQRNQGGRILAPDQAADSAALGKQLETVKAELERSRQSAAAFESEIAGQARRTSQRLELTYAITSLKERGRAIRRQWPDTAFCKRPLREQWWTPGSTQAASTPWLASAQEWYAQFQAARSRFFPGAPDDLYLRSLDLEEVIDFLDDIILSRETPPLHRETHVSAGDVPVLVITAWGAPEGEDEKCGFWIRNTGEAPATNIQLARAAIGSKWLTIYLPPTSVLAKDQKLFVIASLSGPQRVTAYHLEDVFRKLPVNSLNGAKPLGVRLRLIYDARDGTRYASRHEMTLEDTGVIKIGYVNTEILCMPVGLS